MVSQITGVPIVYTIVCSGADKKKKSKLRVTGCYEVNPPVSPHKRPVIRKKYLISDVILYEVDPLSGKSDKCEAHECTA